MSDQDVRTLLVTPSSPAPNYAPTYLAEDLGLFADEGLSVRSDIYAGPGSSWLADNLIAGTADVALGGIWIPLAYAGRIASLQAFAMVCARNPQVLMARSPIERFDWRLVHNKRVLLPLSSTSQWLYLEGGLIEAGQDPSRVSFLRDLDEVTMTRLWRAGLGDFYLVTPPLSEELEDEGFCVATSIAAEFGDVPWSVYYALPSTIERNGDALIRFARALQRALDWLHTHSPEDTAYVLHSRFPTVPHLRLTRALDGLRQRGIWAKAVEIPMEPYMRYQRMIARYGLIDQVLPFDEMVTGRVLGWPAFRPDLQSPSPSTHVPLR